MKQLSRVVWTEGMYLGPHEFQVQAAWFENSVEFASKALCFEPYGFLAYEMDNEALANGTVSVTHARGIFPDGLPFHMRECDALPEPRRLPDLFPSTREDVIAYLAVPPVQRGIRTTGTNAAEGHRFRYQSEDKRVADETTGLDEKAIRVGRKNISIVLDTEPIEDLVTLPLARIRRDRNGRFVFDQDYIPPCLHISASAALLARTERLIEILSDKSASLRSSGTEQMKSIAGPSAQQVAGFWFRHALNSAIPVLQHLCTSHQGHPEQLFREMSRLAGALCSFVLEVNPLSLPLYDHLRLADCFESLDAHIRAHLDVLAPPNCLPIRLSRSGDYFFHGQIVDTRSLARSRWFLSVRSRMSEANLIRQAPKLIKVCSSHFVSELVRRAVPGMELTHVSVPPAVLSPNLDSQYFALTLTGPCWDHIVETKQVGVYVPGEIPGPELELLVLLES